MSERDIVRVAAAVLVRRDGKVLLAQRLPGTTYSGYWEFPGGKLEAGESAHDALARELREELDIEVARASPWLTRHYDYPHALVELNFFRVFEWRREPRGKDGQSIAWQLPGAFDVEPLLPANATVLRALELPSIYAISMAEDIGDDAFLRRAEQALARGLQLIQLREKSFDAGRLERLAGRLLPAADRCGARVLLNGSVEMARRLGCAGIHLTAAALRAATGRPRDMLCAASCHDRDELALAANLGADFAVLGPVASTPTHPDVQPLGWQRWSKLVQGTPIPVYAVGGLTAADLDAAVSAGAHGVALRRAAWEMSDQ